MPAARTLKNRKAYQAVLNLGLHHSAERGRDAEGGGGGEGEVGGLRVVGDAVLLCFIHLKVTRARRDFVLFFLFK
jgi:hypothetical protein